MKPGIKTTELWITIMTVLGTVLGVTEGAIPPDSVWAIILGAAGVVVTYILSRMMVKSVPPTE